MSQRVGRDAAILSEVVFICDVDTEAERQRVVALVVRLYTVFHRAGDAPSILLPVVNGVRKRRDGTFEDRLSARLLPNTTIWHHDLRRNCRRIRQKKEY